MIKKELTTYTVILTYVLNAENIIDAINKAKSDEYNNLETEVHCKSTIGRFAYEK